MKRVLNLLSLVLIFTITSCRPNSDNKAVTSDYQSSYDLSVGDNLDLRALGDLVRRSRSTRDIESRLNSIGSINNIDLDRDGNVDYISVSEYGSGGNRGFTFDIYTPNGNESIANVDLIYNSNRVFVSVKGNTDYYGNDYHYETYYPYNSVAVMSYLMGYHRPYYSPYRYNYYPRNYRSYRIEPRHVYRTKIVRTTTTTKFSPSRKNDIAPTPKYDRNTYNAKTPVRSQKEFTRNNNRTPNTDGFRNKNTNRGYSNDGTSVNRRSSSISNTTRSERPFSRNVSSERNKRPKTSGFSNSSRRSSSSWGSSSSRSSSRSSSSRSSSSRSSSKR